LRRFFLSDKTAQNPSSGCALDYLRSRMFIFAAIISQRNTNPEQVKIIAL
jgi:hypothetical protein